MRINIIRQYGGMTVAAPGWVLLARDTPLLPAFWVDGFPAATPEEQVTKGRVNPIYDAYDGNGGVVAVQYINVTHNTAAVVLPNGSWKSGGEFELWVSPGARQRAYRLPFTKPRVLPRNTYDTWEGLLAEALNEAQGLIGYEV